MSRFRSVRLLCVAGAVGVWVAGVLGLIYYYRRKKKPQKPPPVMQKWPYWKFCRKQGSLPDSIRRNTGIPIRSALEISVGNSAFNPLYPDEAAFFFLTSSRIVQVGQEPVENLWRFTLWCYSFLRHTATPCSSFTAAQIRTLPVVFLLRNEVLVITVEKAESVELLVFSLKESEGTFPLFLRKIQLEDVPVRNFGDERWRLVLCYDSECYVVKEMARLILVLKYEIHPGTNRAHCVLRSLRRIDENWRVLGQVALSDSFVIVTEDKNPPNLSQHRLIRYECKTGELKFVSFDAVVPTHLVNWEHHTTMLGTLRTLEMNNNIQPSPYLGSHASVASAMETTRQQRLLCNKEQAEEVEDTDQNPEEGKKNREKLNLYTLDTEPKTLKTLALSTLLNNYPQIKDLSEEQMTTALGIPSDLAHTLELHKNREDQPCTDLGQM